MVSALSCTNSLLVGVMKFGVSMLELQRIASVRLSRMATRSIQMSVVSGSEGDEESEPRHHTRAATAPASFVPATRSGISCRRSTGSALKTKRT